VSKSLRVFLSWEGYFQLHLWPESTKFLRNTSAGVCLCEFCTGSYQVLWKRSIGWSSLFSVSNSTSLCWPPSAPPYPSERIISRGPGPCYSLASQATCLSTIRHRIYGLSCLASWSFLGFLLNRACHWSSWPPLSVTTTCLYHWRGSDRESTDRHLIPQINSQAICNQVIHKILSNPRTPLDPSNQAHRRSHWSRWSQSPLMIFVMISRLLDLRKLQTSRKCILFVARFDCSASRFIFSTLLLFPQFVEQRSRP